MESSDQTSPSHEALLKAFAAQEHKRKYNSEYMKTYRKEHREEWNKRQREMYAKRKKMIKSNINDDKEEL